MNNGRKANNDQEIRAEDFIGIIYENTTENRVGSDFGNGISNLTRSPVDSKVVTDFNLIWTKFK